MIALESELLSWTPREGLRSVVHPSKLNPVSTPRPTGDAAEIRNLLQLHSAAVMDRLATLMTRQERLINIVLGADSGADSPAKGSPNGNSSMPSDSLFANMTGALPAATARIEYLAQPAAGVMRSSLQTLPPSHATGPDGPSRISMQEDDKMNSGFKRTYDVPSIPSPKTSVAAFKERLKETQIHMGEALTSRRQLFDVLLNKRSFDLAMTCIIVFNAWLIIVEADANARECEAAAGCVTPWTDRANVILLIIYTIESVIVIDTYRSGIFKQTSRLFEIFVVVIGWLDTLIDLIFTNNPIPSDFFVLLKLVRPMRLLLGARLLHLFPELYCIMIGFASAMRTMLWCCMMLGMILVFTAIVSVELINPLNRKVDHQGNQMCVEAFESVWNATLLLFQTITAGDSWGLCVIPIAKEYPATFVFFSFSLVCIQVGFFNLIMSVILDQIYEARARDTSSKLRYQEKAREEARRKWFDLFERLDTDKSGALSLEELVAGFDNLPDFHEDLKLLGIERGDIAHLLNLMDEDQNERVDVHELVSMLEMATHFDLQMHQVTMGMQMRCMHQRLDNRLKRIDRKLRELVQHQPRMSLKTSAYGRLSQQSREQ